ncbi:MAG: hypothetical protein ACMXYK_01085 [Candidatus Woesearchaeota archaeon]
MKIITLFYKNSRYYFVHNRFNTVSVFIVYYFLTLILSNRPKIRHTNVEVWKNKIKIKNLKKKNIIQILKI